MNVKFCLVAVTWDFMTLTSLLQDVHAQKCKLQNVPGLTLEEYEYRYFKFARKAFFKPRHTVKQWRLAQRFNISKCGQMELMFPGVLVGGNNKTAPEKSFPWHVTLIGEDPNMNRCQGVLLLPTWVLTVARCTPLIKKAWMGIWDIKSKSPSVRLVNISRIINHENFNNFSGQYDIALVKLAQSIDLDEYRRTACFPDLLADFESAEHCYVSSFGSPSWGNVSMSPVMIYNSVRVLPNQVCHLVWAMRDVLVDRRSICTDLMAAPLCYGDLGTPLVCQVNGRYTIAGLATRFNNTCRNDDTPAVFTRVYEFADWIENALRKY